MADEPVTPPEEEPAAPAPEPVEPPAPRRAKKPPPPAKGLLADEDVERIASSLKDQVLEGFREAGAFDAPVEPVAPPAQPAAPPKPGETPPPREQPAAPTKRTAAHRWLGVS